MAGSTKGRNRIEIVAYYEWHLHALAVATPLGMQSPGIKQCCLRWFYPPERTAHANIAVRPGKFVHDFRLFVIVCWVSFLWSLPQFQIGMGPFSSGKFQSGF